MTAHTDVRLYAVTPQGAQPVLPPAGAQDVHELFDEQPLGIYEGLRTFGTAAGAALFLGLDRHMNRADRSMALLGWSHKLDRPMLCRALHVVCSEWTTRTGIDARVRFDVLAGPASGLRGPDGREVTAQLLLGLSPHDEPSAGMLEQGVRVGVARGKARDPARIKKARWVIDRRGTGPGDRGYFEHLLLDEAGGILECTSANFFAVQDGALVTADAGMLEGVTRSFVLEIARARGTAVVPRAPRLEELPALNEAFLTSASRNCIPIVEAEGHRVGNGQPGPVTAQLREAYAERSRQEARPAEAFL